MIALISEIWNTWEKLPIGDSKKIAFIANAKDTYEKTSRLEKYKIFLRERGYFVEEVDLRICQGEELFEKLKDFDVVYVGGGNTFYLLEIIRKSGFDKVLPRLLERRIHYIGQSAGACVMGNSIEPMKYGDKPEFSNITDYTGLSYVDFVFIPHADSEKYLPIVERIERDFSSNFTLEKFNDDEGVIVEDGRVKSF